MPQRTQGTTQTSVFIEACSTGLFRSIRAINNRVCLIIPESTAAVTVVVVDALRVLSERNSRDGNFDCVGWAGMGLNGWLLRPTVYAIVLGRKHYC